MSTSAASVFPAASGTVNTRRSWLELNTIKNGTPMQAAATAKAVSQVTGPWESIQTKLNPSIRKRRENGSSERESGAVQLGTVCKILKRPDRNRLLVGRAGFGRFRRLATEIADPQDEVPEDRGNQDKRDKRDGPLASQAANQRVDRGQHIPQPVLHQHQQVGRLLRA